MAHNVKVKYYARENTKMKPHSFYAQVIPNGTYGFERVCEEAARNTTIEAHTIRAAVEEYMRVAQARICDGFRVEIGPQFLTLGPGLTAKVKDELNEDGTVKKACTADDLKATGARSRVTATVNPDFTYKVANSIKWQKTDAKGNALENEEEDATLDDDSEENQNANTGSGSSSSDDGDNGTSGGGNGNGGPSGGGGVDQN